MVMGSKKEPTCEEIKEGICRAIGWDIRKKLLAVKAGGMDNGFCTKAKGHVERGFSNDIGAVVSVSTGGIRNKYKDYTVEQQDAFASYAYGGQFLADIRAITDSYINKYFLPDAPYVLDFVERHIEDGCYEIVCRLKIDSESFHYVPEPPPKDEKVKLWFRIGVSVQVSSTEYKTDPSLAILNGLQRGLAVVDGEDAYIPGEVFHCLTKEERILLGVPTQGGWDEVELDLPSMPIYVKDIGRE